MYYVMIRLKPKRSIKIVNRAIKPDKAKGYVIAWSGDEIVDAVEAKLELRRRCNEIVKLDSRAAAAWKRTGRTLASLPYAPAFRVYMDKLKEEWANSEPQPTPMPTKVKVEARPMFSESTA